MRRGSIIGGMLAFAAMAGVSMAQTNAIQPDTQVVNETAVNRVRKAVAAGTLAQYRKGKNAPTKRVMKRNRLHVRRRVRRKHRRAA